MSKALHSALILVIVMTIGLFVQVSPAQASESLIKSFTISPANSAKQGSQLTLTCKGATSVTLMQMTLDGEKLVDGALNQMSFTFGTSSLSVGTHTFSCRVTNDNWRHTYGATIQYEITKGTNSQPIPYTNAEVGDDVVVVNSPAGDPLLCKTSPKKGTANVISELTDGDELTIVAGPFVDGAYYFVKTTGSCNGYVATGTASQSWIKKLDGVHGPGIDIPYTDAEIGDWVVVVNSPASSKLLCKSSALRGFDNVIKYLTNGQKMKVVAGPYYDNGLYFVKVSGACNGYVATGVAGEPWIEKDK